MKQRKAQTRLICCLSVVGLSLAACSQKATNVKPNIQPRADTRPVEPAADGGEARLFHYSKKGLRQVKIKDTRSTKRVQYEYANLWDRLFDSYALPDVRNYAVEREVSWFVNRPSYLQRAQQRAEPFLYNIVQQIERQGVPGEIALLPVVESAFQAQAVSPAKAAGIWQFIPATGRHYGLKQNHAYDGRRDVYASTRAAIKYLKKLNRQFNGDWLLAIAAYNCGEGAVERAMARNAANGLPTDFWSLDLPQETRAYVPRLLAVSRLMADADHYGVDLLHIPNQAQYKPIKVSQQLDLALAADAADMSLEQFRALNPGFKHTFVDPEGSVRLFVPASKSKTFKKELARLASMQSDLLRREFERPRDGSDDPYSRPLPTPPATLAGLTTPPRTEPETLATAASTRVLDRYTPAASPPPAERRNAPAPAPAASYPAEYTPAPVTSVAYTGGSSSLYTEDRSDPFPAPRVSDEREFTDLMAEQPAHLRRKKTHYRSASSRPVSGHRSAHASEVKKNSRANTTGATAKSERTPSTARGKPIVAYRYSIEPATFRSAAKPQLKRNEAAVGAGKNSSVDRRADSTSRKLNVAIASPPGARAGTAAAGKRREATVSTPASNGSSRTSSGKNNDVRKGERIITAKAEVAKPRTRR